MDLWNSKSQQKRRDKLFIIAEILEIAKEGVLKTQIMYRASLSFAQLNEYLKLMERANLIDKIVENGKGVYKITQKGLEFLQHYHELMGLLKTGDKNCKNGIKIPPAQLLKRSCT